MSSFAALIGALVTSWSLHAAEVGPRFVISCRADLVGAGHLNLPEVYSDEFTDSRAEYSKSRCQLKLR